MRPTLPLTLLLPTAHSALNTLTNKCPYPLYYTSVASTVQPTTLLPSNSSATVPQYYDGKTGTAIKFTLDQNGLYTGKPALHFSYTYKANESIYYGIATSGGYDFNGRKVSLVPEAGKGAESIVWDGAQGREYTAGYVGGELALGFTVCDS